MSFLISYIVIWWDVLSVEKMWTLLGMVTIVRIFQILRNFFGCFFYRQTRNIESFEEPSTQVSCTKILSQKKTCELGLGCASYNPILCAMPCLAYSASFTGFQLVLCLIDNTFTHNLQPHTYKFIKTMYVGLESKLSRLKSHCFFFIMIWGLLFPRCKLVKSLFCLFLQHLNNNGFSVWSHFMRWIVLVNAVGC